MGDPDDPATPVPMQVGEVVGPEGAPVLPHVGKEGRATDPTRRGRGRTTGVAWTLAVGLAVAITLVAVQDRTPRPVVVTPPFGAPWAAPDAPTHQVIRRWEWAALAVHRQVVVVQTIALDRGQEADPTTVTAIDTLTGDELWRVDVPMSRPDGPRGLELAPTVHVVDESIATTLTPTVQAWPRGASVGLDARSGRLVWRRDDVLGVERPVGHAVLAVSDAADAVDGSWSDASAGATSGEATGAQGSRGVAGDRVVLPATARQVVDLRTGKTVFATTGTLAATETGWVAWQWHGGDRSTARILTATGEPMAELPSDAQPAVFDDLVVTQQATGVVVSHLDGRRVWAAVHPDLVPAATPSLTTLLPIRRDVVLASVHHLAEQPVASGDGDRRETTLVLLHADGTTTAVADQALLDVAAAASFVGVVDADGTVRLVCTSTSPAQVRRPAGCPGAVALLGHDADRDAITPSSTLPATTPIGTHLDTPPWVNAVPTVPGVVVAEPGAIVLRSWQDLAPLWRIGVDDRRPGSITVATSARGVAVGVESAVPSTVTWLS